jgi:radical SAM superfamily enzyme YgiQ (UPF0313 family)
VSKPPQTKPVLLLKPKSFAFSNSPPLGLMSIAAYLRTRGHASRVLDVGFEEDAADLWALADSDRPVLFGVTATTPEFPEAVRLVHGLKARFPDVPVVVGGIHVSALGVDAVAEAGADYGVCGEGEETLAELVAALGEDGPGADLSGIRGLIIRDGNGGRMNAPRPVLRDVDALPPPAWDLIRSERYFVRPWHFLQQRSRSAFVMTSRGCPSGCTFCASHKTLGRAFRGRSPEVVVDEIEELYRNYAVREFLFVDDNITFDRDRAAAICEEILRRGLDISWRTPNGVRIDTLDAPLVELMRQSGCYLLGFGIESGDRAVLKRTNKKLDLDRVADLVAMVRSQGLITFGYFILGLPGETFRSGLATIRYAAASQLDLAHFGLYAPYPGSADFARAKDQPGLRDWNNYLFITPFPVSDLSPMAQKTLLRLAYPAFYLHPARMRLLARMMGPRQVLEAARVLYHYMA